MIQGLLVGGREKFAHNNCVMHQVHWTKMFGEALQVGARLRVLKAESGLEDNQERNMPTCHRGNVTHSKGSIESYKIAYKCDNMFQTMLLKINMCNDK